MKIPKVTVLSASLFLLFACAEKNEKYLDLEKVGVDFNVSRFYQAKLDQTNETLATDPKKKSRKETLDLLNRAMFGKDTLCFYHSGRFVGQYINPKSDFTERKNTNEGIFGYAYHTLSWNEKDSLAVLNHVYFQKIDMLETKDGTFLSLNASNESNDNKNYLNLSVYLKKKYGTPKSLIADKHKNLEVLNWELKEEVIQLSTKIDTVDRILSISLQDVKEIKREPQYHIEYLKINKKHVGDLKKIKTGSWMIEN